MWVKQTVFYQFSVLINNLIAFHEKYGKDKNQTNFTAIKGACEGALSLLSAPEMSETADVEMANLSNIIQIQLAEIIRIKSGREDLTQFMKDMDQVKRELSIFSFQYKDNFKSENTRIKQETELKKKQQSTKIHLIGMEDISSTSDNIEVLDDSLHQKNKVKEVSKETSYQSENHMSDIYIPTEEDLSTLIKSLAITPVRHFSLMSFFKSAANHYPKTVGFSVANLSIGGSYALLQTLNHYAGPALENLIHSAIGLSVESDYVIAGTLLLVGVTAGVVVAGRNLPSVKICQEREDLRPEERISLLA